MRKVSPKWKRWQNWEKIKRKRKAWCEGTTTSLHPGNLRLQLEKGTERFTRMHLFFSRVNGNGSYPYGTTCVPSCPSLCPVSKIDKRLIVLNDGVNDDVWMKYCLFANNNNNNRSIYFIWGFLKHDIILACVQTWD